MSPKIITKEAVKPVLGFENALPSITAQCFQKEEILFGYTGEAKAIMASQSIGCTNWLQLIEQLNTILESEIEAFEN